MDFAKNNVLITKHRVNREKSEALDKKLKAKRNENNENYAQFDQHKNVIKHYSTHVYKILNSIMEGHLRKGSE